MTKLDCPGFKGLKWKWMQDHAKEQEQKPAVLSNGPESTTPPTLSGGLLSASDSGCNGPTLRSTPPPPEANGIKPCTVVISAPPLLKVEHSHVTSGPVPALPAAAHVVKEEPPRPKEEQESKLRLPGPAVPTHSGATVSGSGGAASGDAISAAGSGKGPSASAAPAPSAAAVPGGTGAAGGAALGPGPGAAGASGNSNAPGTSGRREPQAAPLGSPVGMLTPPPPQLSGVAASAPSASLIPPPPAPAAGTGTGHGGAPSASTAGAPGSAPGPSPVAPAGAGTGPASATQPAGAGTAAGPGPGSMGASRPRPPPSRGPSMTVAATAAKGGDDFDDFFTPLSSLPALKAETPAAAAGPSSRTGVPGAVAGGTAGAAGTVDAGLSGERRGHPKKASRLGEGRNGVSQPSSVEPPDIDHGPAPRGKTSSSQPGSLAAAGSHKDPAAGASGGPGKGQSAAAAVAVPQPPKELPQRASGPKAAVRDGKDSGRDGKDSGREGKDSGREGKDAGREGKELPARDSKEAAKEAKEGVKGRDGTASEALPSTSGRPAAGGSGAREAKEGGEQNDRKRPRQEAAKPSKAAAPTSSAELAAHLDSGPYDTLADRIKRAKRAATSSSDHDGPHSHGGSADRHVGQAGAGSGEVGHCGAGDEAAARPTHSGEAQSPNAGSDPPGPSGRGTSGPAAAGEAVGEASKRQGDRAGKQRDQAAAASSEPQAPSAPHADHTLRTSGGGAVTDSSGGGAPRPPSKPPHGSAPQPTAGAKRMADFPSTKRNSPAKRPHVDPQLPRPHAPERRSGGGAGGASEAGASGRPAPLPTPSVKQGQRAASGKAEGTSGEAQVATGGGAGAGAGAPASAQPPRASSRPAEPDPPAAGSYKGPLGGSRGSKDGAADKGACGPRSSAGGVPGGAARGGGGGAATTTTEPKTDSDTRTVRVIECFFELDQPRPEGPGVSASLSGLGSTGSGRHAIGRGQGAGGGGRPGPGPGTGPAQAQSQQLDLSKVRSFKELWGHLAALYDGSLPDEMDTKLIYLDEEGDWIMVTPDEPWASVAATATKMLVTHRT